MEELLGFVPGAGVGLGVVVEPCSVEGVPLGHPVTSKDLVGPRVVLRPCRHLHFSH